MSPDQAVWLCLAAVVAARVLEIVALYRGTPRAVAAQAFALWAASGWAAMAVCNVAAGDWFAAFLELVFAVIDFRRWWNSRPPRPPRRKRVLKAARAGT